MERRENEPCVFLRPFQGGCFGFRLTGLAGQGSATGARAHHSGAESDGRQSPTAHAQQTAQERGARHSERMCCTSLLDCVRRWSGTVPPLPFPQASAPGTALSRRTAQSTARPSDSRHSGVTEGRGEDRIAVAVLLLVRPTPPTLLLGSRLRSALVSPLT